jgi:ParB family chromosome partitioning protein
MRFDLDALETPGAAPVSTGGPLMLELEAIEEDPEQPRAEFDPEALRLLAETIAARGVRAPVSVRSHPEREGHWILNYGARRLRAARLAGMAQIPAFVDETADSFDQVIENEQRENLQPLELALFVQRQMRAGLSQAEIARRLGKTRGYMTFLGALIDAPDWLLDLYRHGGCRGMTELYELRSLHDENPEAVSAWLRQRETISRGDLRLLRASLSHARTGVTAVPSSSTLALTSQESLSIRQPQARMAAAVASNACRPVEEARSCVLWARLDGDEGVIDLTAIPKDEGFILVRRNGANASEPVPAARLQLLRAECVSSCARAHREQPK